MQPSFLRHAGFISPEVLGNVTLNIIGVGATGSHIGRTAACMGFTCFRVWDHDKVEDHNLPNQIYLPEDVDTPKVSAFVKRLLAFNPEVRIEANEAYYTTETYGDTVRGPLIIAVDSMKARKDIWDTFHGNHRIPFVVETGLGFSHANMSWLNPMNLEQSRAWLKSLKTDEEIPEGPCNLRLCVTLVQIVASAVVQYMCHYYAEQGSWSPPPQSVFALESALETFGSS